MRIQNKYHKLLNFEISGKPIGIKADEIIDIEDSIAKVLLKSPWIELVEPKKIKKIEGSKPEVKSFDIKEKPKVIYKGRK